MSGVDAYSPFWPWSPEEMDAIRWGIEWRRDNLPRVPSTSEGE